MLGQLAGLVNKPRHKDEDDKDSEEALVAWRGWGWGLAEPGPAVCRTALTHDAAPDAAPCPCPILPFWGVHAVAWIILTPLSFPEFSLFFIKPAIFKKSFKKYINLCLRVPLLPSAAFVQGSAAAVSFLCSSPRGSSPAGLVLSSLLWLSLWLHSCFFYQVGADSGPKELIKK